MKNTIGQHSRKIGFLFWTLTGGAGLGLSLARFAYHGNGWLPLLIAIPMALLGIINSWPDKKTARAIEILQGCGLHGQCYDEVDKCAEGVREIILSLRADCNALVQNYDPIGNLINAIRWVDGKFQIFIGAGGLPKDSGWDVLMSSGFSCSYQTSDPKAVRRLLGMGYTITQQAADKLNEL